MIEPLFSCLKFYANWMHEDVLSKKWMQIISWFLLRLISHYMQTEKESKWKADFKRNIFKFSKRISNVIACLFRNKSNDMQSVQHSLELNGNLASYRQSFSGIVKTLLLLCNGSRYGNWQFNSTAEKYCFPQKNAQFSLKLKTPG